MFRVEGLGLRVQGLGFGVGLRSQGSGLGVSGLEYRNVWSASLRNSYNPDAFFQP